MPGLFRVAGWVRLGWSHTEQQMLVPSLGTSHLHGLVSKLGDHAFWNGRWGMCQAFRGKPLGGSVAGARENQWGVFSGSGWVLCDGDLSQGSEGLGPLELLEHLNLHVHLCLSRVALRWKHISVKNGQGWDGCSFCLLFMLSPSCPLLCPGSLALSRCWGLHLPGDMPFPETIKA